MVESRWTRPALLELVDGARLFMRGPEGEQIPAPEWLVPAAQEVSPLDSAQSVDATHPDDRNELIAAFLRSFEHPGKEVVTRIRVQADGVWHHSEVLWLNLLGHPDVDGILGTARMVEGPAIEAPERAVVGNMDATNWMIAALDEHGRVDHVRGRLEEVLGYSEEDVAGRPLTEFIHTDCVADAVENWIHLWEHPGQTRTSRWVWRTKDGRDIWLESSYLVHDDDAVEVVIVDVNEQVVNEQALAASQAEVAALAEDFRLLADEVPTAVFRCDAEGRVQFHNAQWTEMFHGGGEVQRVHDVVEPTERHLLDGLLAGLAAGDESAPRSIEVQAAGDVRVLEIRCRAVGGTDGGRFVGSISDVTAAAHFRHQALHDQLTGLANRSLIELRLAEAIEVAPEGTLVAFIDLDGFKAVNDEHGHEAGDAVLAEVGRRLSRAVRPGDTVARYGGDEFVVVCLDVTPDAEQAIIHRLSEVFVTPIELDEVSWVPGASLGLARPAPDVDAATVLRRADQAMFEQKRARRGALS